MQPNGLVQILTFPDGRMQFNVRGMGQDKAIFLMEQAKYMIFSQNEKQGSEPGIEIAHAMPDIGGPPVR